MQKLKKLHRSDKLVLQGPLGGLSTHHFWWSGEVLKRHAAEEWSVTRDIFVIICQFELGRKKGLFKIPQL